MSMCKIVSGSKFTSQKRVMISAPVPFR
uniref:Uncharacterized protein n=1 Tax=Anguilla anguilla TaxID=7936 RepID=A0A0E9P9F9_ANGAN